MEENKRKVSLAGLFLILAIIVIIAMGCYIVTLLNEQKEREKQLAELNIQLSQTQAETEKLQEKINGVKDVLVDEKHDKEKILNFINKVWTLTTSGGALQMDMEEFSNIKEASQDYLVSCAVGGIEIDTDNRNVSFDGFNSILVKYFGEEANELLLKSSIEKGEFEKNNDGTYILDAHCGDEYNGHSYIIDSVEENGKIIKVKVYEYKTYSEAVNLSENEECLEYIYDMKGNTITTNTVKCQLDGDAPIKGSYHCVTYNNNDGKYITSEKSLDDYLLENYKNKLSVRNFELQYNEETNSYIMLSNNLEK